MSLFSPSYNASFFLACLPVFSQLFLLPQPPVFSPCCPALLFPPGCVAGKNPRVLGVNLPGLSPLAISDRMWRNFSPQWRIPKVGNPLRSASPSGFAFPPGMNHPGNPGPYPLIPQPDLTDFNRFNRIELGAL